MPASWPCTLPAAVPASVPLSNQDTHRDNSAARGIVCGLQMRLAFLISYSSSSFVRTQREGRAVVMDGEKVRPVALEEGEAVPEE